MKIMWNYRRITSLNKCEKKQQKNRKYGKCKGSLTCMQLSECEKRSYKRSNHIEIAQTM